MNSSNQTPGTDDRDTTLENGDAGNTESRFANLFRRKKKQGDNTATDLPPAKPAADPIGADSNQAPSDTPTEAPAASSIEDGLAPTRNSLLRKIGNVFKGTFDLNDELFEELEETLIGCDIGVAASLNLVDRLRERVKAEKIQDAAGVFDGLRREISELLNVAQQDWQTEKTPHVILIVGVNGVGKTTTTAKIANYFKMQGKTVMLAAADTFRAAAVEQLQEWGHRLEIPVITQGQGADAAAVAHDALTSAIARDIDVLLIDTAGRLHTQSNLMEQLIKIKRVLQKIDACAPHEIMQILDAGTGQNALSQLDHFHKAVGVSSLCLTKLDGSAKGGVVLGLTEKFRLPIRFIGVGENLTDLKAFNAADFAAALIPASLNL